MNTKSSLLALALLSMQVVSYAIAQEPPAAAAPPAPEVVAVDAPRTTVGGNAFVAPAGWKVTVKDRATIIEAPEGNSRVVLVDVTAKDADAAVAAAWAQYGEARWPMVQKSERPDRDGWSGISSYAYQTSPEEKRIIGVNAR